MNKYKNILNEILKNLNTDLKIVLLMKQKQQL